MRYAPRHRRPRPESNKLVHATGAVAMTAALPLATTGPLPAIQDIGSHTSTSTPAKGTPIMVSEHMKPVHYFVRRAVREPTPTPSRKPLFSPRRWHHARTVVSPSAAPPTQRVPVVAPTHVRAPVRVSASPTATPTRVQPKVTASPSPTFTPTHTPSPTHSATPTHTAVPRTTVRPTATISSHGAAAAVAYAKAHLGWRYVYGGTGAGGFDCSGLVYMAWKAAGVTIPRTSSAQYAGLRHVSASSMQPGDILVFYSGASHVGIYIGGGMMIHAPHTGTVVQKTALAGYYQQHLIGVVRP